MKEILFSIDITSQMIYLFLILIVIGVALKNSLLIENWCIIWILMVISIIVSFIFFGISFKTLFESILVTSLSNTVYQLYKQTRKGINFFKHI